MEQAGGTATDTVTFLGTAGARVMVASQILESGGLWFDLGGTEILLDPGPGTLVRAVRKKLKPTKLAAIILTHRHLDHSADANIMIEAMTEGGLRRRGTLYAPADALEEDPVVLRYLRPYLQRIEVLKEGESYSIGDVSFHTPIRHRHPVETYGVVLKTPRNTISCLVDTRFFRELCDHYQADLLILNVVLIESGWPVDHLSVLEAGTLIKCLKPRAAILTHFGMSMWRAKPWEVADRLSQQTGIEVIAARDGMTFDLAELGQDRASGGTA